MPVAMYWGVRPPISSELMNPGSRLFSNLMLSDAPSFSEWSVLDEVDGRRRCEALDIADSDVAKAVVVRAPRLPTNDAAEALKELLLHGQPRKFAKNRLQSLLGDQIQPAPHHVHEDSGMCRRDLGLLVNSNGVSRVKRNGVPDQLDLLRRDAALRQESPRRVSAIDLEALCAEITIRQPKIVENCRYGQEL